MPNTTHEGNVGNVPELRFTPNGQPVCNFSVAVYGGRDEEKNKRTLWVRATTWGSLAESVNKLISIGSKVFIEGNSFIRDYVKTDGNPGYSYEMTCYEVGIIARQAKYDLIPHNGDETPSTDPEADKAVAELEPEQGDLPF